MGAEGQRAQRQTPRVLLAACGHSGQAEASEQDPVSRHRVLRCEEQERAV